MAPIRSSNLERDKWRTKCREQLSKHIRSKIGIVIEPSQVRLITGADNPYIWKVLPEKKHLFTKNLSDHSIRAYKELCKGIGVTFEAVPPSQVSFSARVDELQAQNLRLERELNQWKGQATAESERRWRTDQELDQLKNANQTLHRELQRCAVTVDHFRKNTSGYAQVMRTILQLMEELKTGTSYNEEASGELEPLLYHAAGSSI